MRVSELTGALLDYWVARAEGERLAPSHRSPNPDTGRYWLQQGAFGSVKECPRYTDWAYGGPIIEREFIELTHDRGHREDGTFGRVWQANCVGGWWDGDTPLIAAMRAYVASKFGDEVPGIEGTGR